MAKAKKPVKKPAAKETAKQDSATINSKDGKTVPCAKNESK